MRIKRTGGSIHLPEMGKKQIVKLVLAVVLALVVIAASFFAVYWFSHRPGVRDNSTRALQNEGKTEVALSRGETCMLTLPENVDVRDVRFTSSDDSIVRVDDAGRADGLAEGEATVSAKSKDFSASCVFHIGKAQPKQTVTEVTTAVTANQDALEKNRESGTADLFNIVVNRRTNTVTVYTYDSDGNYTLPVRAMVCSCGAGGTNTTPVGDYKTLSQRDWATLYGDATHEFLYGQYVTEFYGEYLFHSVPYEAMSKDTLETEEFNKLGTNASQGCVRLMMADVYWIYTNCPLNTPVHVIDADSSADPLGTPPTVRQNIYNGWDPTDPDENNPFKGKLPRILGLSNITITEGDAFDPMEGVTAKDICGNLITDRMTIKGEVIADKPGTYYLTYSVTDDFRLSRSAVRTVIVEPKATEPPTQAVTEAPTEKPTTAPTEKPTKAPATQQPTEKAKAKATEKPTEAKANTKETQPAKKSK